MTLKEAVSILRQRWAVIATIVVLVTGAATALSTTAERTYESTASVYYSLPFGGSGTDLLQGSTYARSQMLSFAELAEKPYIVQEVIDDLGLDTSATVLGRSLQAQASDQTVLIDLTVSSDSAEQAAAIANSWAGALVRGTQELSPQVTEGASIEATVVQAAQPPRYASSPNTRRNVLAGLAAGLLLGMLGAFARDRLDTKVRQAQVLGEVSGLPVLGQVPVIKKGDPSLVMIDAPGAPQSEAYRRVRTNLRFLGIDKRPLVVILTSATPGEGKTTTTLNLAAAIAQVEQRVLVIDADLRRPEVAHRLGLEHAAGLSTILIGDADVDDVVQQAAGGYDVIASGAVPPNPSELLSSAAMKTLLNEVRQRYDVVLIDTPPCLPVSDAATLAPAVSGVVVVARSGAVRRGEVTTAIHGLRDVGARVLGTVLNGAHPARDTTTYYGREVSGATASARHSRRARDAA